MATQYTAGITQGQVWTADIANQIGAAWETWSPQVTQNVGVAGTVSLARYTRIQKLVIATFAISFTGGGTAGTAVVITLPITANSTVNDQGSGFIYDTSAATMYSGTFVHNTTTSAVFVGDWAGNGLWGNVPNIALANGDLWRGTMIYEAA